ncbi:hypothetical protein PQ478_20325 [Alkalihalophilus pseudofirmus]|uniref:hypothetical protein n=1 Tax=Alkalihalophilus pseudofirmus TaxID=79885 RepID=UPI00259B6797|nr:hypothetical protein [Alkalihalophilus pseudofirmus]WEG16825.1 hypothetical protein PQ478_20325 [Alkalihalophilus pseudofirmus]
MNITKEQHRELAVNLLNQTRKLINKQHRTEDEDLEMIHSAQASSYHWRLTGNYINWSRGEWLTSRVYATLGSGEEALRHAEANKRIAEKYMLSGYDAALVAEALARAYQLLGETEYAKAHLAQAHKLAAAIEKESDRQHILSELNTILE